MRLNGTFYIHSIPNFDFLHYFVDFFIILLDS